jgi:hypothetical protein
LLTYLIFFCFKTIQEHFIQKLLINNNLNNTITFLQKDYSKQNLLEKFTNFWQLKQVAINNSKSLYNLKFKKFIKRSYKRTLFFKTNFHYKRYFLFLLRKLKYRKKKKKIFKNWCRKPHWYTPKYLEIDYNTLRASFVYYPEISEVHFGFLCSFNKIISFYKERAL